MKPLMNEELCEFVGHEWTDVGGGLQTCMVCGTERWLGVHAGSRPSSAPVHREEGKGT